MNPFDFLNEINHGKNNIIKDSDNPELVARDYNSYVINKTLSYFADTLNDANQMNLYPHLENDIQFDYLINKIRSRKRFTKWSKPENDENLQILSQYFRINLNKARDAMAILSAEDIDAIKTKIKGNNDGQHSQQFRRS